MNAIYVEITATRGSTPRDTGTVMKVTPDATEGTIGGGALEFRAIETARRVLVEGAKDHAETIPLGPGLGQCCGGAVTLLFTRQPREIDGNRLIPSPVPDGRPTRLLWVWGAGHVGRAIVKQAAPTGAFAITWIDTGTARFPGHIPDRVTTMPAADMPSLARYAPRHAHHLIVTYAHDIDLALCATLLTREAASIGLIGSDTKWARFKSRLRAMGLDPAPIICPIGDKTRGKHPDMIAHTTIVALLGHRQDRKTA